MMSVALRSLTGRSSKDTGVWPGLSVVLVALTTIIIIVLLAVILWLAFYDGEPGDFDGSYTLRYFSQIFGDGQTYQILLNTLWFSITSLVVAVIFGLPLAWIVERSDLPGKPIVLTGMTVGLLIPGFADAMGWVFLLHPRVGLINTWASDLFGLSQPLFNIGTIVGMGWVQGLNLAPVIFIMTAAVLRAMDPALEEAAQMSGANFRATMRRVTLAASWSGILAALIYVFTIGFGAFDVPAIIGWGNRIFTFSTYVVLMINPADGDPQYGQAAVLSTIVIVFAVFLGWWYNSVQQKAQRYSVVTGRGYRPRLVPLRRWTYAVWGFIAAYFVLSKILPILVLIWASLLPFFQLPSATAFKTLSLQHYDALPWPMVWTSLSNTALLMVVTPSLALVISLGFSWVTLRTRLPGRGTLDFIAFLPHAIPHIVFALATLFVVLFVLQPVVPLYGTLWGILIIFVVSRVSYGTRMTNSGLIQIHKELEESARVSGANTDGVLRNVVVPLLRPTFVYAWLWIALLSYRELTLAVVLTVQDNMTVPVLIWRLWEGGGLGPAAALSIILMVIILPLIALYWVVEHKRGTKLT